MKTVRGSVSRYRLLPFGNKNIMISKNIRVAIAPLAPLLRGLWLNRKNYWGRYDGLKNHHRPESFVFVFARNLTSKAKNKTYQICL